MAELIIGSVFFVLIWVPLIIYLLRIILGKQIITKKELLFSWISAILIFVLSVFQLILGAGISSFSFFEFYFILLAIVEPPVYKKQS